MRPACSLLALAALPLAAARDPTPFFKPGAVRVLILSGRNNHDWRAETPVLRKILDAAGRFDVRINEEPAGVTAGAIAPYDVLVNDYNGPRWGAAAEAAVDEFVRAGKGMVVVHGASYAFGAMEILGDRHARTGQFEPPWAAYGRMVGATWSAGEPRTGHGKRHAFTVRWTDRGHPVAAGLPASFVTSDELYHNFRIEPGVRVLATAFDAAEMNGTGKEEPLLWAVDYGKGRVFHTALGHDTAARTAAGFAASFARGVEWAASGAVTLPAEIPLDTPARGAVRVLVVTGGHEHEPSFYTLFEGQSDVAADVNPHPNAFRRDVRKSADVVVFYDLNQEMDDARRKNLRDFIEAGKGVVVLHHALADFNAWPWWYREVVGGRYLLKPEGATPGSTYKHDVELTATPTGNHPVTRGLPQMRLIDETYKGMWISPDARVLLRTDEPTSDGPLGWISPYANSRVVVIQLGHGSTSHRHPAYRQLVRNAILWSAGRLE